MNDFNYIDNSTVKMSKDQWEWFGERLHESSTGRVIVPSHCYKKFRAITGIEHTSNEAIKCWLISNVYNIGLCDPKPTYLWEQ